MKKLFKYLGILVGVLVLVIIAAVIIVPMVFDPNDHKDTIAKAVMERTGRALDIDGEIKLSVFPWLGVDLGRVVLGNATGFSEPSFLSTDRMQVRVKLMPLLKKQVEMDTVRVDGLALNLARKADGQTNWDDLIAASQSTETTASDDPPAIAALAVGGVNLQEAEITWDDAQAGSLIKVSELNLDSGALSPNKPASLSLEFNIAADEPKLSGHIVTSGEFGFDPQTQIATATGLDFTADLTSPLLPGGATTVSVKGDAVFDQLNQALKLVGFQLSVPSVALDKRSASLDLNGDINADLSAGLVSAKGLTITSNVKGDDIPSGAMMFTLASDLDADLKAETLTLNDYRLTSGKLSASGSVQAKQLLSAPEIDGALNLAGFNPRELLKSLGQSVPQTKDPKALSYLEAKSEFSANANSLTLSSLVAKLDDTLLKGQGGIDDFTNPSYKLDLALDKIDADRYLPPGGDTVATPGAAGGAASGLPVETLRALNLNTQLAVGELKVSGLALRDIRLGLKAKDGLISASPLRANLYGGSYNGNLALDARGEQAKINLNEELKGVRVGELLKALAIDTGDMDLSDAAGDISLQAEVTGDPAKQVYVLNGTRLKTNASGKALPGGKLVAALSANMNLNLASKVLKATQVNAAVDGLKLPSGLTATGSAFAGTLHAGLDSKQYQFTDLDVDLKALQLNAKASNTPVRFSAKKLDTDLKKQTLSADGFDLAAVGLRANGQIAIADLLSTPQVAGVLNVPAFNARNTLKALGQTVPKTADPKALTSVSMTTTFKATQNSVNLNPLSLNLDDTKVNGSLSIADLNRPSGINFDLTATSLNADRYLPPQSKNQAATPGAAATAIPIELLRTLDANGKLTIGKLIISNLQLTDIKLNVNGKNGLVKMQPVNALLYGGSYEGDINIDATGNAATLSVNERLKNINIGPLLRDLTGDKEKLAGRGDVHIQATGTGKNTDQIKKTLNGQTAVVLRDGAVKGIDLVNTLCNGLQSVGLFSEQGGGGETKFADMSASANITNGLIDNRDLEARSPLIRVGGKGTANLVNEKLDYLATARLVGTCKGQGGLALADLSGFDIPVRIRGSFSNPKFEPDFSKVAQQSLSTGLGKKLEESLGVEGLGTLLGGSKPAEQPAQSTGSGEIIQEGLPADAGLGEILQEGQVNEQPVQPTVEQPVEKKKEKPKKTEEVLEDIGKDLLKGLFN